MYRAGQGALDQQIAQTIAAIGVSEHCRMVDTHLRDEMFWLQERISTLSGAKSEEKRLSIGSLWSLLRKNTNTELELAIHQADQVILMVALKTELEFVQSRRKEIALELNSVAGATERLTDLLAQKESRLLVTDSPQKDLILEIARIRGNWQALLQCVFAAFGTANDAQSEILQTITYVEDAHDPKSRHRPGGFGFGSGSQEGQLQQASAHAGMAGIHVRSLEIELASIQFAGKPIPIERNEILVPADSHPFNSQVISHGTLTEESRRISDVISALADLRRHCKRELDALESKRRQALGDRR